MGSACGGAVKFAQVAPRGEAESEYRGEPQLAVREGGGDGKKWDEVSDGMEVGTP